MDDRVVNAINAELTAKGWTLVQEGADVGIDGLHIPVTPLPAAK